MKSSELFVQCLEAEGVEYIFGLPGEENYRIPQCIVLVENKVYPDPR